MDYELLNTTLREELAKYEPLSWEQLRSLISQSPIEFGYSSPSEGRDHNVTILVEWNLEPNKDIRVCGNATDGCMKVDSDGFVRSSPANKS